jgi:hypothetical protein
MLFSIGFFFNYSEASENDYTGIFLDYSFVFIDSHNFICQYDPLSGAWVTEWKIDDNNDWEFVAHALLENML